MTEDERLLAYLAWLERRNAALADVIAGLQRIREALPLVKRAWSEPTCS